MKKNPSLFALLAFIALIAGIAALLLPIGPGFMRTYGNAGYTETFVAYDFVFGNKTQTLTVNGYGAMIAAFVLLIIAASFEAFALLLGFSSSVKFGGFLACVAGICAIVSGVIYILAKQVVGVDSSYTMQWGFLGGAIAALVSGLVSGVAGVLAFKAKQA
jgi:hypothetical protein